MEKPRVTVDVQYASMQESLPMYENIRTWIEATLTLTANTCHISRKSRHNNDYSDVELTVRIVDEDEGIGLNRRYRGRETATNVLSFPCNVSTILNLNLLGDIVICAPVVEREASMQYERPYNAHWAHMVIHGTLHLLGYDHQSAIEARYMESMETVVLTELGFPDPYQNPR
uniref:Endoribonuclease YbeY n=1 Tax=Candidatus Kentrum sp. TUN TaxID=2126343 RepID=A0A451A4W7_9GAMM|nr:MAG: probable rRNA maturation factor [Candidatus Kentron sp. TUN]VFK70138.1 MAG: probable rRNA maturation factor [Candidatus Kentron sp. TUN]